MCLSTVLIFPKSISKAKIISLWLYIASIITVTIFKLSCLIVYVYVK